MSKTYRMIIKKKLKIRIYDALYLTGGLYSLIYGDYQKFLGW